MKLHAGDRRGRMREGHDLSVILGGRDDAQRRRKGRSFGRKRMIARGGEALRRSGEKSFAVMDDAARLAVHLPAGPDDAAAKGFGDRLQAEADAEDRRSGLRGEPDEINANSGVFRGAWPGRQRNRRRGAGERFVRRQRIVAHDFDLPPETADEVDEVEGEAVIIVDQQNHSRGGCSGTQNRAATIAAVLPELKAAAMAGDGSVLAALKGEVELLPPFNPVARALERRSPGLSGALLAAALGVFVGVGGALLTGRWSNAAAARDHAAILDLREAPLTSAGVAEPARSAIIAEILTAGEPERLSVVAAGRPRSRPKLVVIFDDMGLDREAFEGVMALPGPVTLSFLPYAEDVQPLVDRAKARGDDILLHLPMEPNGSADPGPHSLSASMGAAKLFDALAWNFSRFDGYVGVNNHMGSKFTRDEQAMKRVLAMVEEKRLLFIDSLTTGGSVASEAGAAVGADVFVRDVFLDAEPGKDAIERQLALAEAIAAKTGYAIVICHPRRETIETLGPWLTTAPARGFDLATASELRDERS